MLLQSSVESFKCNWLGLLGLSFYLRSIMSNNAGNSSLVLAQKAVKQLRVEAGVRRIKVCKYNSTLTRTFYEPFDCAWNGAELRWIRCQSLHQLVHCFSSFMDSDKYVLIVIESCTKMCFHVSDHSLFLTYLMSTWNQASLQKAVAPFHCKKGSIYWLWFHSKTAVEFLTCWNDAKLDTKLTEIKNV